MISIFVLIASYYFYRKGIRCLFKSKLLSSGHSGILAYIFSMLSGVVLGEYISITTIPELIDVSLWGLILITTLIAIIAGELVYLKNSRMVKKIVYAEKK